MRIVVCVKHVPDLQSERAFDAEGRVVRVGGEGTLNELDENALQVAADLVAEQSGEVIAVTVGPADAADAVRRAFQRGADRGVHVVDDAIAGSDVFGTAVCVAAAIRRLGAEARVDLVLTGMAALDGLTSMLPAALAAELGLPQLTLAARLTLADGVATVRRDLDNATETLTAPLPAVISVTDQINEPAFPSFLGIMAARKKTVEAWSLADLSVDPTAVGAAGARTRVVEATPRPPREHRVLIADDGDAGRRLAEYLIENKLV